MSTVQTIVDLAREDLNDADKVRWSDADLLAHANAAIKRAFVVRPDLAFGLYGTAYDADKALADACPLPARYDRAIADYVIGRAHLVDDEGAAQSRTPGYLAMFDKQLKEL